MPDEQDRATLAADALAAVTADARARGIAAPRRRAGTGRNSPEGTDAAAGDGPPGPDGAPASPPSAAGGGADGATRPPTSRSARRPRRDDPAPLSAAIDALITDSGWSLAAATGSVFGRWAQIVGADLAAHTTPEGLADGELTVSADSTAWATQVRLLAAELVRKLNAELGTGTVRRVRVLGPAAAARRPGQWRVKGSRGPRDTYG
jgi:predicted nucleic acid-binding Zn ribbon protein